MKDSSRYLSTESLKLGLMANTSQYDVKFVNGENPYIFRVDSQDVFVYIKNLSPAQLSNKNPDIWRIQLPVKEDFDQIKNSDSLFILLGYDAENDVYTSWNPYWCKQRLNVGKSVSLYSRYSLQQRVHSTGEIEIMSLNNESDVVCIPAKSLYLYIKNIKTYFPTESLYVAKGSRINKRTVNDPQALFELFVSFDDSSKFEAYMRSIGMSERAIKDYVRNLCTFHAYGYFDKYRDIFLQCSSIDEYEEAIKVFRSQPDILAIDEKNHGYLRAALRHYVNYMKVMLSAIDDEPSIYNQPQKEEKKPYKLDSFGKLVELDPALIEQLLPFVIGEDYPDYDEMIAIAIRHYPQEIDDNMAYSDWISLLKGVHWKKKRVSRKSNPSIIRPSVVVEPDPVETAERDLAYKDRILLSGKVLKDFVFNVLMFFYMKDQLSSILPFFKVLPSGNVQVEKEGCFKLTGLFIMKDFGDIKQRNNTGHGARWFETPFIIGGKDFYLSTQWYDNGNYALMYSDFKKMIMACYGSYYHFDYNDDYAFQLLEKYQASPIIDYQKTIFEELSNLSTVKIMGKRAPHKAILLLAIMDLVETGEINSTRIELTPSLEESFKKEWDLLVGMSLLFNCRIATPFWHMQNEPFYSLFSNNGESLNSVPKAYPLHRLRTDVYAVLSTGLFDLMKQPLIRGQIRELLINTYL